MSTIQPPLPCYSPKKLHKNRVKELAMYVAISKDHDIIAIESNPERAYHSAIQQGEETPWIVNSWYMKDCGE